MEQNPAQALVRRLTSRVRAARMRYGISMAARAEMRREKQDSGNTNVSIDRTIGEALAWIGRAQDNSPSVDGGVARHYCLITGWGASYPETTGYIVPTIIREAQALGDTALLQRARTMLDWLVSIQMPGGGFRGGVTSDGPAVPVTFNTGQILMGLAAGVSHFGRVYRPAMIAAADWLVETQDADGCWRKHGTPYAAPGEKAYETHVAWGLYEAARVEPGRGYAEAATKNLVWALSHQKDNGWFSSCCLTDPLNPLTHTLGYALRGLVEGYLFTRDGDILDKANRTAEGVLSALHPDGFLPGRLDSQWRGAVPWACLTGTAQMAACWLLLYRETGNPRFREAAFAANRYVMGTMRLDGPPETRGAVKGSFPVSGGYVRFQYPNWACKFLIDAISLEKSVRQQESESAVSVQVATAGLSE
ncbi:MAG: prenyltransferase/squalene oxidase repeat-containing protein [Terriglobales bacterium]